MERFIRLNRSILDCDLAKGGWRLDEEGITAIEDEIAELVRIIAQSRRGDIPRERAPSAPPSPTASTRRKCNRLLIRVDAGEAAHERAICGAIDPGRSSCYTSTTIWQTSICQNVWRRFGHLMDAAFFRNHPGMKRSS